MWLAKSFSLDFFAGFGIGLHQLKRFNATQVYDGVTDTWKSEWEETSNSWAQYVGNIGIKIGIGSGAN